MYDMAENNVKKKFTKVSLKLLRLFNFLENTSSCKIMQK